MEQYLTFKIILLFLLLLMAIVTLIQRESQNATPNELELNFLKDIRSTRYCMMQNQRLNRSMIMQKARQCKKGLLSTSRID